MIGVITGWDVLAHPVVTVRCFGWRVFFKAVTPWQGGTFLSLLRWQASPKTAMASMPTIIERCILLELRAKRIYAALAKALSDQGPVGPFFAAMASQEQDHADLLDVARHAAIRGGFRATLFNPWQDYLPRLEQQMEAAEASVAQIDSIEAALRLTIQIESSEINQVFPAAITATDSRFVKRLKPFRKAMESHISYIVERIPQISPSLMLMTRELRAKFSGIRTEA
ncbi:MAG: ferritin family protein [Thermoguttaceae bacterium]